MKEKVNLYQRHTNGRFDTYQFSSLPYPAMNHSSRQASSTVNSRESRLNAAYSVNYNQACLLLQAIRMNGRRRLSAACIMQLATFVGRSWEAGCKQEKIDELAKLMTNLMDTTLLCPGRSLDEALKEFCRNDVPTHSVSPSITLLIAIGYIERLKQKYQNIKGTNGCGHRLIMIAYMMAAKFMHVNLRSIIDTAAPSPKEQPLEAQINNFSTSAGASSPHQYRILPPFVTPFNTVSSCAEETQSTEHSSRCRTNDTLSLPSLTPSRLQQQQKQQLPSPPTSPKSYSDTDPLKYHYFRPNPSRRQPATSGSPTFSHLSTSMHSMSTTEKAPFNSSSHTNNQQPPSPPQSGDIKSQEDNNTERQLQIKRMELEFLHFLNYDLTLSDTPQLIHWAQKFDDDLLPPIHDPNSV